MKKVTINDTTVDWPSSWNELTRDQLICVAELFSMKKQIADFRVAVIMKFLSSIKKKVLRQIDGESLLGLALSFDFLLEKISLTKSLLPRIGKFYGPADNLKDISFNEFVKIEVLQNNYRQTSDVAYINEICAVLYRPRRKGWFIRKRWLDTTDCRARLRDKDIVKRARKISKLPVGERWAVYLLVVGVMEDLSNMFPYVFTRGKTTTDGAGWPALIISLADGRTDNESLDRVMDSNMYNVLMGLEQRSREYYKFLDKMNGND